MSNIICNEQGWRTDMYVVIYKIYISMLDLNSGFTGNRYPLYVRLSGQFKKGGDSSWRHWNTTIPNNMNYNTQRYYDPSIQYFMWGDSSELKSGNSKKSGLDGLNVRNKVTLNDEKVVCLRSHMWINYMWCRLSHINILYLERIRTSSGKGGGREYWFWYHVS